MDKWRDGHNVLFQLKLVNVALQGTEISKKWIKTDELIMLRPK